uniref:Immunoglobulin domain-containing protein n=1 Tax=Mola mola TaxID=94237 RepID=A0A3Q3WM45_MOLML
MTLHASGVSCVDHKNNISVSEAHLPPFHVLYWATTQGVIITIDKVPVKLGDSVTIPCLYDSKYKNHVKYLCKGKTWSCSYAVKTDKPSSGKFSISDDRNQRIFTVTINDLTDQDTDYWCAVEIVGGSDSLRYLYSNLVLYVDRQEITGFKGEKITISCHFRNTGRKQWCRLGGPCVTRLSGSIDGMSVTISNNRYEIFNVTMRGLTMESSGWYWCAKGELQMPVHLTVTEKPTTRNVSVDLESLIIPLSVLILIVMVALVIWFILKKQSGSSQKYTTHINVIFNTMHLQ